MPTDPISQRFPRQAAEIAALRQRDPRFDEVCTDFETLYLCLPEAAHAHRDSIVTLTALEAEIRSSLAPHPTRSGEH